MDDTFLKMEHIDKIFTGTQALRDVSFDIRKGEIHSLIGTNGSGKSTLANIMAGVFQPTNGKMLVNGQETVFHTPSQAIKNGIIIIHQELKLIPEITVAENIFFGRFHKSRFFPAIDWKAMNANALDIIQELGAGIKPDDIVSSLSVARQQMVEIAKALSQDARIIIMDEPTASLTQEETKVLFNIIRDIQKKGVSVVYISHRLDEILEISDRITVLRDSKLITTVQNNSGITKDDLVRWMIDKDRHYIPCEQNIKNGNSKVAFAAKGVNYSNKLHDISFELKEGEVLGIAGLIGAGRTELLKCIFGVYPVKSGEFYVKDKKYVPKSPIEAVKNRIALISEDRKGEGLVLKMSVSDNMLFPNFQEYMVGPFIKHKRFKKYVDQQVNALNLKCNKTTSNVENLSGGNQQKVVIGKWLLAKSNIILMDEPTRGIDVGAKDEIYTLVRRLANEGKSVVFVSSELEEVQMVSDRILVMYNGRIVGELDQNNTMEEIVRYATGTTGKVI